MLLIVLEPEWSSWAAWEATNFTSFVRGHEVIVYGGILDGAENIGFWKSLDDGGMYDCAFFIIICLF